ncbi:MAG: hypothetical protein KGI10_04900 [Thaumarchaeota archaeon]|nr:hypothetical protein [Nitrososphaerota archaeon]
MHIELEPTYISKSKKYSQEILESVCDEILTLDPNIRFAGIISNKGKLLTGNKKKGIRSFVDPRNEEILLMETALGIRMRKEHDSQLGSVNFTISYGDKLVSMNFPLEDEILCVSAEKNIDLATMPFLILSVLKTNLNKKEDD